MALGRVYTFGPTFRAENSNTSRHLAEFWMLEPEMAFCNLNQDISCAEAYLKYCIARILKDCPEEMDLFDRFYQKGLIARLEVLTLFFMLWLIVGVLPVTVNGRI